MKLKHSKHGLKANPIGAHVTLTLRGRTLLGEVRGASRNTVTGAIELDVRHFNGEPWPLRPTSWAVDVLARDYMRAEADALQEACLSDPDTREGAGSVGRWNRDVRVARTEYIRPKTTRQDDDTN